MVYHHRPHDSLVDPHVPGLRMSPAQMFEHGVARAGYIEVPAIPIWPINSSRPTRKIQHYGVDRRRRYNGPALNPYRNMTSPYKGKPRAAGPFTTIPTTSPAPISAIPRQASGTR